ncbi:MAG: hypothetical protein JO245_06980, partial [Pseudolabrys sp.]|nr:hypothetical protein [Pseudolabrys sp.]
MFASIKIACRHNARVFAWFPLWALAVSTAAYAQDIRGLEVCTAEKQIERRTSCLQSNVEFLQKELAKQARDTEQKLAATARELAAAKAEAAALRASIAKIEAELDGLKKSR